MTTRGRPIQPGEVRNPTGKNQYSYRRDFERSVDRLLGDELTDGERERLGIPEEVLELLPDGASRGEAIAHITVLRALRGEDRPFLEVLARIWPKLHKHQVLDQQDQVVTFRWKDSRDAD